MYSQSTEPNPKTVVKTTIIIHLALLIGQVLFMGMSIVATQNAALQTVVGSNPLFFILLALIIGGVFIGTFLYRKTLSQAADKPTLKAKLAVYQTASIIRWAMSEGASLFGIVCFLITSNYFYLCVTAVNVLYFVLIRPTKLKIQEDLNLDYQEQAEMEGNTV